MSLQNLAWRITAVIVALMAGPSSFGQVYHPFGDPLDVDPDWQFFAPVDVEEMTELSPRKRTHHGWFGAYDRTYMWVSRPDVEISNTRGDFGWGNRYDLGFMGEEDRGWLVSFRNIGGPNVYDRISAERIDRQNALDTGDPTAPILPPGDANDPQLGYRVYVLGDSLNVAGFSNFELNRTWRMSPYRYGGMLEPMIGFKYATFKNTDLLQQYSRDDILLSTGVASGTNVVERLSSRTTESLNQMVGGQLGARYFNHSGRWTLSGEFRAFGMANFQSTAYTDRTIATEYTGIGGTVVMEDTWTNSQLAATPGDNTEFVLGFEARAEAAYHVTKYFQVRAGIDVVNFASGIWRAQSPAFNGGNPVVTEDQTVEMAGFTFGVQINR
ncbi:MAG: hypothetical protein AB8B50_09575 [Pirellulaceae bacterium]